MDDSQFEKRSICILLILRRKTQKLTFAENTSHWKCSKNFPILVTIKCQAKMNQIDSPIISMDLVQTYKAEMVENGLQVGNAPTTKFIYWNRTQPIWFTMTVKLTNTDTKRME